MIHLNKSDIIASQTDLLSFEMSYIYIYVFWISCYPHWSITLQNIAEMLSSTDFQQYVRDACQKAFSHLANSYAAIRRHTNDKNNGGAKT